MQVINGSCVMPDPKSNLVYFGEQIVSIRTLMKRYNFHRPLTNTGLNSDVLYSLQYYIFNFPVGPGPTYGSSRASPTETINGLLGYNVVAMTHIRYFGQAYIAWRGSVRYKLAFIKGQGDSGLVKASRSAERIESEVPDLTILKNTGISRLDTTRAYLVAEGKSNSNGLQGYNFNSALVNPTLEYEVPMYHPYRYVEMNEPPITPASQDPATKYQGNYEGGGHYVSMLSRNTDTKSFGTLESHVAIGEDFSFFFFIGASPIYDSDVLTVS